MRRSPTASVLLLGLLLVAADASPVQISFSTGDGIELRDDVAVITPEGVPAAEISPAGDLRIAGRRVRVGEREQLLLARYNLRVRDIHAHALEVGLQGAGIGISALGAAIVAVATGDHERAERMVQPDAERLKASAQRLCREVQELRAIQDLLARSLPPFRPYALMDDEDRPRCEVD